MGDRVLRALASALAKGNGKVKVRYGRRCALTLAAAGRGRRQQEGVDVGSRKQMRRPQQEAGVDVVGSTWRGVDVGSREQMRRRQQEAGIDVVGSRKQMWIVLNVVVRTWRGVDVGSKKTLTEGGLLKEKKINFVGEDVSLGRQEDKSRRGREAGRSRRKTPQGGRETGRRRQDGRAASKNIAGRPRRKTSQGGRETDRRPALEAGR